MSYCGSSLDQLTDGNIKDIMKGVGLGYSQDHIVREFGLDHHNVWRYLFDQARRAVINGMMPSEAAIEYDIDEATLIAAVERERRYTAQKLKDHQEKEFISNGAATIQKLTERVVALEAENEKLREAINELLLW